MVRDSSDQFAGRLRRAWGRPELGEGERAAFDAALRQRLQARPRRGRVWVGAGAAVAAASVAALMLLPMGSSQPSSEWLDTLAEAREAGLGTSEVAEGLPVYGLDGAVQDESLLAVPTWDAETERLWDSSSVDLSFNYEVLAYWLAPANSGNGAGGTVAP